MSLSLFPVRDCSIMSRIYRSMWFHSLVPCILLGTTPFRCSVPCRLPSMPIFFVTLLAILLTLHPHNVAHAAFPFRLAPFRFSSSSPSPSPSHSPVPSITTSAPPFTLIDETTQPQFPPQSQQFNYAYYDNNANTNPFKTSAPLCPHVLPSDTSSLSISVPLHRRVAGLIALLHTPAGMCTATVVGRSYLLTAAHCLRNFNASASRDSYRILFPSFNAPESSPVWFRVDGGRVADFGQHLRYRDLLTTTEYTGRSDQFVQYDVAWLRLETPRTEVTPVEIDANETGMQNAFFMVNKRDDTPTAGSTVRVAGFPSNGRYSAEYSVSENSNYKDNEDYLESRRYTARQTDLAVSFDPQHTCGFNQGYNASTQICVGFGEIEYEDTGFLKERDAHYSIRSNCYPWYVPFQCFKHFPFLCAGLLWWETTCQCCHQ